MSTPAGWHPDPYGRFAKRYWDGARWTEHVVDASNEQRVDPMGTSTVRPIVLPTTATGPHQSTPGPAAHGFADVAGAASAAGGGTPEPPPSAPPTTPPIAPPSAAPRPAHPGTGAPAGTIPFLERMAPDSRERPRPLISTALAGIGGAMAASGLAALLLDGEVGRAMAIVVGALLTVTGGVLLRVSRGSMLTRAVAVGVGAVGLAVLALGITANWSTGSTALAVVGVLFGLAWLLPGYHGRPLMLGVASTALVAAAVAAVGDGTRSTTRAGLPRLDLGGWAPAYVALILGSGLLFLVWWLDSRRYHGTATALVYAALGSSLAGTALVASRYGNANPAGPILVGLVGCAMAYVGSHGDRRLTTWVGAAVGSLGVALLVAKIIKPTSPAQSGSTALLAGAALICGAAVARTVRAKRVLSGAPADINRPE